MIGPSFPEGSRRCYEIDLDDKGRVMQNGNGKAFNTHLWSDRGFPHLIKQDGETIIHRHCLRCGRDFGKGLNGADWCALYVGVLRVELLADSVNQRWLTEECPREPLWAHDQKDRAMLRN